MNMVECKRCTKQFDYLPGVSGNARQLCDECRETFDKIEIDIIKEESVIEGNKYLVGAPKRKEQYDVLEIMDGNFPVFNDDSERFIAAVEVGKFINKVGFGGKEANIEKFLKYLGPTHRMICIQQWSLEELEIFASWQQKDSYIIAWDKNPRWFKT